MKYKELLKCVACDSSNLSLTLDLNNQPLANSYKVNKFDFQKEYPIKSIISKKTNTKVPRKYLRVL